MDFDKINFKANNFLKYIIDGLNFDRDFYDADFSHEYSPFEESIKKYCDLYCDFYLENDSGEIFFNSLVSIFEIIVEIDCDMYYEDFFRPVELMTYYLGKLILSDDILKDSIFNWMADFIEDYTGDMIVEEYLKLFINGEKIYHADDYYTDYKDFNKVVLACKI